MLVIAAKNGDEKLVAKLAQSQQPIAVRNAGLIAHMIVVAQSNWDESVSRYGQAAIDEKLKRRVDFGNDLEEMILAEELKPTADGGLSARWMLVRKLADGTFAVDFFAGDNTGQPTEEQLKSLTVSLENAQRILRSNPNLTIDAFCGSDHTCNNKTGDVSPTLKFANMRSA